MNLANRSYEQEIMDDLNISGPVIDQTLKELDVINRNLGGNQISLSAFRELLRTDQIRAVADLGCGGADILIEMARIAKHYKHAIQFTGVDANPHIVEYATNHTSEWSNIKVECDNIFSPSFVERQFDIIHCCLFLHHFSEDQLVDLFQQFKKQARVGIIVNDLHRHALAYYSIKWLTRFLSKSYMVRNDASVSVSRGFKRHELKRILNSAAIHNYSLKWKWAFRWQLVIPCSDLE